MHNYVSVLLVPPAPPADIEIGISGNDAIITWAVVDTTIVGGKVLMENRKLNIGIDEAEAAKESAKLAAKLWDRF